VDDNKKDQIRKAALAVFARRGFHETTVAEIAQEAGIAKGTIYLYYASKEELLIAIFRRYIDGMLDFVDGLIDSALSVPDILSAFVGKQTDLFREEPDLMRVLSRRSLLALSDGNERMVEFQRYLLDRITALLERGKILGEMRALDVRIAACAMLAVQEALPLYLTTYADDLPKDALNRATQQLAQFMWASVRKEPA
jgi:TetR/AcrR family transcriptional regulator, fatty acid metabolism regulator protein